MSVGRMAVVDDVVGRDAAAQTVAAGRTVLAGKFAEGQAGERQLVLPGEAAGTGVRS